ncbi:hypothetical protein RQP46_006612 [Phenoliferia psychrophenolica]
MPTPNRKQDLNSPASPSSPTPSRKSTSASAAPPSPAPRGPTPPTAETAYHKRLRAILLEHKRFRKEWNELVIRGCLARTRAAIEIWADVENGLKHVDRDGADSNAGKVAVRAGYLFHQSSRLSEQTATIYAVLASLEELLFNMNQLAERAESLVIEAAKTRGTAFAFREPLWVTWPLARFSDGIQSLTAPYTPSLILVRTLIETLTTFPALPSALEDKPKKELGPVKPRPKPEEIQAAMSLLAVQPLLPGKGAEGAEAWEETLAVEVGGWA